NTDAQRDMAKITNKEKLSGNLADALKGADVFVGVSKGNLVSEEMVRSMNEKPVILAMANPTPEIMPDVAIKAGAYIVGTGRSDFPNQINNVLVFPGIFKGALKVRATDITESMKIAAAKAIASVVSDAELRADYIVPDPFNPAVADVVANAVAQEAIRLGISRI
ncbi:MAG: malic enzyme-like NAD(P)-binding protein, partial [Oscillospiraceae bacterium]